MKVVVASVKRKNKVAGKLQTAHCAYASLQEMVHSFAFQIGNFVKEQSNV